MPLFLFSQTPYGRGSSSNAERRLHFALSAAVHVAAFGLLISAPDVPTSPPPSQSEYKQAIEGREDKIVS